MPAAFDMNELRFRDIILSDDTRSSPAVSKNANVNTFGLSESNILM